MATDLFRDYPKSVLERFKKFHAANPQVYETFKEFAYKMRKTGRERYSARTIVEAMRWHIDLQTKGDDFEINGDFVPIMVRLLIHNHPEFAGFFELRKIRSKGMFSEEQLKRKAGNGQVAS